MLDKSHKKVVFILRGVSGSGKSSVAEELIKGRRGIICTADDYFDVDGEYKFDSRKLGDAHSYCQSKFVDALIDNAVDVVVVANTNTTERDFSFYQTNGKAHGADVFFLVIENRHDNKDIHNVPDESLKIQEQRIKNSLKLR